MRIKIILAVIMAALLTGLAACGRDHESNVVSNGTVSSDIISSDIIPSDADIVASDSDIEEIDTSITLTEYDLISDTKTDYLVGTWMASPCVGAGYNARYHFFDNGLFIYEKSEYDGTNRIISESGSWSAKGGKLVLSVISREILEGGEIVGEILNDGWDDRWIQGGEYKIIYLDKPEVKNYNVSEKAKEDPEVGKLTIKIGKKQFWKFDNLNSDQPILWYSNGKSDENFIGTWQDMAASENGYIRRYHLMGIFDGFVFESFPSSGINGESLTESGTDWCVTHNLLILTVTSRNSVKLDKPEIKIYYITEPEKDHEIDPNETTSDKTVRYWRISDDPEAFIEK